MRLSRTNMDILYKQQQEAIVEINRATCDGDVRLPKVQSSGSRARAQGGISRGGIPSECGFKDQTWAKQSLKLGS